MLLQGHTEASERMCAGKGAQAVSRESQLEMSHEPVHSSGVVPMPDLAR